jgi:hypothetical protein
LIHRQVPSSHVKRAVVIFALLVATTGCGDDRIALTRGPLGPAAYDVEARAHSVSTNLRENRRATLRVLPRAGGTAFSLETPAGQVIDAQLRRLEDGSVRLDHVSGAPFDRAGETELASIVGQLDPPLPRRNVHLGQRWSSTKRIRTDVLRAEFRTVLRLVRFRRIASTDAAELQGTVTGRLHTSSASGVFNGTLEGQTRIDWAVRAGRVVAAETRLLWRLAGGDRVTLETRVRPR